MRKSKVYNPLPVYCISGLLIVPLIMINPFIGKIYSEKFTSQALMRLYSFIPHFSIALAGIIALFRILLKHYSIQRVRGLLKTAPSGFLVCFLCVFLYKNIPTFRDSLKHPLVYEEWRNESPISKVLDYLDQNTKKPYVVCANCFSGQYIPAITKHHLVQVFPHITSPSMRDYTERTLAREIILSSESNPREKYYYIRKYRVKYIFLDYTFYKEYMPTEFEQNFKIEKIKPEKLKVHPPVFLYELRGSI